MAYGRQLPVSTNEKQYDGAPPAFVTNQSQKGVPLVSSVITLSDRTTVIEIMPISGQSGSGGILGKWGVASVNGTNFDIQIPVGATRQFVVPQSVMGNPASVAGANVYNGLYPSLSVINATAVSTSIFSVEY